jgi:hypothetical protein
MEPAILIVQLALLELDTLESRQSDGVFRRQTEAVLIQDKFSKP